MAAMCTNNYHQVQHAKDATARADKNIQSSAGSAEKKFDEIRAETGKSINAGIDKFDKNVEKGAAQSKSWIGSWFGGK
jgi:antirestriction protein ArdC